MFIRNSRTALAVALSLVFQPAIAAPEDDAAVLVTATRIPYREADASYAAEVHTRSMIERSGAQTLVDYLGQHTSLTVMPYYGNRFTPTLEMRGYGLETGNQNVVVTLDGQRINTIDLQPQLLGAIPLSSIDRVEITKGSGSVMQGDGAMAGTIRLFTRPHDGVTAEGRVGSHGVAAGALTAGIVRDNFSAVFSADHDRHGGFSESDSSGKKDASRLRAERAQFKLNPTDALQLSLDLSSAHADTRFQNPLTLAQFSANPAQNGGAAIYTNYVTEADRWRLGADYALSESVRLTVDHHRMDQQNVSTAGWGSFSAGYDSEGTDVALIYRGAALDLTAGWQQVDASRVQTGFGANRTSKNNSGLYLQGSYRLGATTLSAGAREESVRHIYAPAAGVTQSRKQTLDAWDLGLNHRFDEKYTAFANLNASFQAPDVDRFFNFGGAFNGFITTATAKTLTAGIHRVASKENKFKLTLFRANLNNEIYYDPVTFNNTNIDKSHKYGIELYQYWKATPDLALNASYAWTRAMIDRENSGGGAYDGKEMPGVPRHAVNLSLTYAFNAKTDMTATHAWRSKSFAISDFDNNNAQRQAAFESTSLTFRHKRDSIDYFATLNNLFARKNGLWTGDNTIYPINYLRSFVVGAKVRF